MLTDKDLMLIGALIDSRLDARFDAFEKRIDAKFDAFEKRIEARFIQLENAIAGLYNHMNERFDEVEDRLDIIEGKVKGIPSKWWI